MHNCPQCGQPTQGTWSEGGTLWSICLDCYHEQQGPEPTAEEEEAEDDSE